MPDSIGGFYASLKLNVDSASFNQGLAILKQFKNEINGIAQIQRLLSKVNSGLTGGSGARSVREKFGGWGSKAAQDAARAEERNDKLMAYFAKEKAKRNKQEQKNTDDMNTSTKWMIGAVQSAVAKFLTLGAAIKLAGAALDNWNDKKVMSQTARGLSVAPIWLQKWETAMEIAGGKKESVATTVSNLNKMFADPKRGLINAGMITQISGILGMATKDPKLLYGAMSKLSPEAAFSAFIQAAQNLYNKGDRDSKTNAMSILQEAGLDPALLTFKGGYGEAYRQGNLATLMDAGDMAKSELAGIEVAKLSAKLKGVWEQLAANLAEALIPALEGMNKWFDDNRGLIKTFLKGDEESSRQRAWSGFLTGEGHSSLFDPGTWEGVPDWFKRDASGNYPKSRPKAIVPQSSAPKSPADTSAGGGVSQEIHFHVQGSLDKNAIPGLSQLLRSGAITQSLARSGGPKQ